MSVPSIYPYSYFVPLVAYPPVAGLGAVYSPNYRCCILACNNLTRGPMRLYLNRISELEFTVVHFYHKHVLDYKPRGQT
jgi:hypothetical protein